MAQGQQLQQKGQISVCCNDHMHNSVNLSRTEENIGQMLPLKGCYFDNHRISLIIRRSFFFQNNPKNLDLS